ncbi:MAG: YgfZ/GcvT domain-containing protein [Blastocatellia bacterium]
MNDMQLQTASPDVAAEYRALRHGVGVLNFLSAAVLEIRGKNAIQFINGLVTNDVKALAPGFGVPAVFPDGQGKVSALCRIYKLGDAAGEYLLLQLSPERREKIYGNLKRFTLAGEFFLEDRTDQMRLLSLQGPRAAELIGVLTGALAETCEGRIRAVEINGKPVLVASHPRCGETGFDLLTAAGCADELEALALEKGQGMEARLAGPEAFEIARVEAGVPLEIADVNETHIVLEAGLDNAVSYTKGCYLGQEIIARIHWRGQPAKRLLRLAVTADSVPTPGAELPGAELYAADGKKVGQITSAARLPDGGQMVALGYVHRYYIEPGTALTIRNEDRELGSAVVSGGPATAVQSTPETTAQTK